MNIDIDHFGEDLPIEYNPDNLKGAKPIKQGGSSTKKKKVDHSKRTTEYWEKLGYRCDKLESWQNVNGMWVRKDFVGCFDFLATKLGETPVLIQTCAKGAVTPHLRKMMSKDELKGGESRRSAFNYYFSLGWRLVIQWFDQPGGHGTSWLVEVEPITQETIDLVDSGKRVIRK